MFVTVRHRLAYSALVIAAVVAGAGTIVTSQAIEQPTLGVDRARVEALMTALRQDLPYIPGELLVKFRDGTTPLRQNQVLRLLRAPVDPDGARWIGDVLHLWGLDGEEPVGAAAALARQPEVLIAEPNYILHLHTTPNDPGFRDQWNMELINMPRAWEINADAGRGVVVAVVDSGLTTTDGTLGFRIWKSSGFALFSVPLARASDFDHARVRPGVEFTPLAPAGWSTAGGSPVLFDASGHGTHVAGTMAQQTSNATGYAGIANGATLLPVKVCFSPWDIQLGAGAAGIPGFVDESYEGCDLASVARGIRYAVDDGAKVINVSIGAPVESVVLLDALQYAVQRGAFVALSAGNDALTGNRTMYPAAYASTIDGVVAVGAVTRAAERARYSSYGSYVELAAPGGALFSGLSEDISQMFPNQEDLRITRVAPAFSRYGGHAIAGTSMAAPHVAGVAALAYSQGITNPAAIEAALKRFARDLGPPGRDDEYGYGLIDARATLNGMGLSR